MESIKELTPLRFLNEENNNKNNATHTHHSIENLDPDAGKSKQEIIDEIAGQLNLFDNINKDDAE